MEQNESRNLNHGKANGFAVAAGFAFFFSVSPQMAFASQLPQLNPEFFVSQIFWLALIFGAFYWGLSRVVLPRFAAVQDRRRALLQEDLHHAAEDNQAAREVLADLKREETAARARVAEALAAAEKSVSAYATERLTLQALELAQHVNRVEGEIKERTLAARQDLRRTAAELAQMMAARFSGLQINAPQADAAVARIVATAQPERDAA